MSKPKISICIPTWESYGFGEQYLKDLFDSIKKQTFHNYEVCISDHSQNNFLLNLCEIYANYFNINYFHNTEDFGNGPANTNSAIEMANGEIIKIMFQDDFFYSSGCLSSIVEEFTKSNKKWLVSGCNHYNGHQYYNEMHPSWNYDIIKGVNTISSPSVLSFKSEVSERFDPRLIMMMDCDYYFNLYQKYGEPIYLNQIHIANRIHDNQISSNYLKKENHMNSLNDEINYCLTKYNLI